MTALLFQRYGEKNYKGNITMKAQPEQIYKKKKKKS